MQSGNFARVFGRGKPVIAMVHFGALPGSPLYDEAGGIPALIDGCAADLAALQDAGVWGNQLAQTGFKQLSRR